MKVVINRDDCIECGACAASCSDVFVLKSGNKSAVVEKYRVGGDPGKGDVPQDPEKCAKGGADACCVGAITAG